MVPFVFTAFVISVITEIIYIPLSFLASEKSPETTRGCLFDLPPI
jgi:hypothetical protein